MASLALHLILLACILAPIRSDIGFEFGISPKSQEAAACNFSGTVKRVPGKVLTTSVSCQVDDSRFVSGLTVRLLQSGEEQLLGGVILERSLGHQEMVVKVWSAKNESLRYEIRVYEESKERLDPHTLESASEVDIRLMRPRNMLDGMTGKKRVEMGSGKNMDFKDSFYDVISERGDESLRDSLKLLN